MVGNLTSYWITWFPGSLLAAIGVLTLCWKGIKAFVGFQQASSIIVTQAPNIEKMLAEFSPNGGSTLRDQVDSITKQQGVQDKRLHRLEQGHNRMEGSIERIEEKVDRQ